MLKKGLLAGLINLVLGMILSFGLQTLFPDLAKEYQNIKLFRPWTDPLMMAFFAYPFILGIAASYFWSLLGKALTGDAINKALKFAGIYFVIATIPGMFVSYTTFQVSLWMVLSWTLTGLLEVFVAGLVFAKLK